MKSLLSEKGILIIFCALFAISSLFLFFQNSRALDPDYQKNWWTLSFAAPEERTNLDFIIENHSQETEFHYQIVAGKEILLEQSVSVGRSSAATVTLALPASTDARTTVRVTASGETQEIYR